MRREVQWQDVSARLWPASTSDGLAKTVTFCVTDACQLRCNYCYETGKASHFMSLDTARKFVDLVVTGEKGMSEYISPEDSPSVILEFIGGEPFLAPGLMDEVCGYWMDRCIEEGSPWAERFMVSVCSNGVAYREPEVQRFLSRWGHRLSFSVTVDGTKEMHDACRLFPDGRGSYDLAADAAADWMARGHKMGSKLTVAPGNVDRLAEAVEHMFAKGYRDVWANCVYEEGWTLEHARVLFEQMLEVGRFIIDARMDLGRDYSMSLFDDRAFRPKDPADLQNWCGGNGVMVACGWDGRIYPCIRYMETSLGSSQPPVVLGDVERGLFSRACERECFECLRRVDRRTQSTDECFFCPIAEGCSWCTAYNYQVFGTPDRRATFICPMHKARALANAWFWPRYREALGIDEPYALNVPDEWALEIVGPEELSEIKEMCDEAEA